MRMLGVPYTEYEVDNANIHLQNQSQVIADNLKKEGIVLARNKELIAVIAYMQRMGTDIKNKSMVNN